MLNAGPELAKVLTGWPAESRIETDQVTGLFAVAVITSAPPTVGLNAAGATERLLITGAVVSPGARAGRTLPDPAPVTSSVRRLGRATIER